MPGPTNTALFTTGINNRNQSEPAHLNCSPHGRRGAAFMPAKPTAHWSNYFGILDAVLFDVLGIASVFHDMLMGDSRMTTLWWPTIPCSSMLPTHEESLNLHRSCRILKNASSLLTSPSSALERFPFKHAGPRKARNISARNIRHINLMHGVQAW